MVSSLKRKIRSGIKHSTKTRKKAKTDSGSSATIDSLPWKTLSHAGAFGDAGDDGILELEEVENVQVVYEETPEGRVVIFKVRRPRCDSGAYLKAVQMLDAHQIATSSRLPEDEIADVPNAPDIPDEDVEEYSSPSCSMRGLLPEWDTFELHDQLLRALHRQSFTKPTPIQLKALPPALQGRDVVGVAETVRLLRHPSSSKTYTSTGIGQNSGVWITTPTQAPFTEETSSLKGPETSARADPSPHS